MMMTTKIYKCLFMYQIYAPSAHLCSHSCFKPSRPISCLTHSSHVIPLLTPSLPQPPYFCKPTPSCLHSCIGDAWTISICHASPHLLHSVYVNDYTIPNWTFYSSMTPHIHLTINSLLTVQILSFLCQGWLLVGYQILVLYFFFCNGNQQFLSTPLKCHYIVYKPTCHISHIW